MCRALRLDKVLVDPRRALPRIEDAVLRVHRAMQIGTALLARETLRSLGGGNSGRRTNQSRTPRGAPRA